MKYNWNYSVLVSSKNTPNRMGYSAEEKTRMCREVLENEKPILEVARIGRVHSKLLNDWIIKVKGATPGFPAQVITPGVRNGGPRVKRPYTKVRGLTKLAKCEAVRDMRSGVSSRIIAERLNCNYLSCEEWNRSGMFEPYMIPELIKITPKINSFTPFTSSRPNSINPIIQKSTITSNQILDLANKTKEEAQVALNVYFEIQNGREESRTRVHNYRNHINQLNEKIAAEISKYGE